MENSRSSSISGLFQALLCFCIALPLHLFCNCSCKSNCCAIAQRAQARSAKNGQSENSCCSHCCSRSNSADRLKADSQTENPAQPCHCLMQRSLPGYVKSESSSRSLDSGMLQLGHLAPYQFPDATDFLTGRYQTQDSDLSHNQRQALLGKWLN